MGVGRGCVVRAVAVVPRERDLRRGVGARSLCCVVGLGLGGGQAAVDAGGGTLVRASRASEVVSSWLGGRSPTLPP